MADEMRKYNVTYTKEVLAISETQAECLAAAHFKNGDVDRVRIIQKSESIADRLRTYRNELPNTNRNEKRAGRR